MSVAPTRKPVRRSPNAIRNLHDASTTHDQLVARRFDALRDRFKVSVAPNDFRLEAVIQALGGRHALEGLRILDVGCGKGRFARRFNDLGAEVVGVDLARGMLLDAPSSLRRIQATAWRLPLGSSLFDAVVSIETLEHVADPVSVLVESARVLRPGGVVVILDKNVISLDARRPWLPALVVKRRDERLGRWMYPPGQPIRERWFTTGLMAALLKRAGFEQIQVLHPLAPEEARTFLFRLCPLVRRFIVWTGQVKHSAEPSE